MPIHAFVDESRRNSTYYVASAVIAPAQLGSIRKIMRALLLPNQREIHFYKEKLPRRRAIADTIARLPIDVHIYHRHCDRREEPARQACLWQLVNDLLDRGAHRLVMDTREERDHLDRETFRRALAAHPHNTTLVHEHLASTGEPLLWIADIAAWCYGTGGDWRARISPVVRSACDVGMP